MATLNDWLTKRPVNRTAVDAHKNRMLSDIRAYKLRELREAVELTQADVAGLMKVSQNSVSKLERGNIDRTQVDYIAALR
ncbi:helix-turn-helix protein [Mycobacterium marinum]|uniref:helix-turn-helix domain-containing protein n=1 Tax=Mycobacterium marinum TaxID=1781 RepID=UPI000EBCD015|nr:helix-turn-helix protein [Mycobacterium marinum]